MNVIQADVCSECGYPLIADPEVLIEYGPECGDCGGPALTISDERK